MALYNMKDGLECLELARKEMNSPNPDLASAFKLLNEAHDYGVSEATYALATWYLHGTFVEKDWHKGASFLKDAASKKYPDALYDLAVCYEEGKGLEEDMEKAFQLYLKAALRGDRQSISEVGRCYFYGIGIAKDEALADVWLERAEELGIS